MMVVEVVGVGGGGGGLKQSALLLQIFTQERFDVLSPPNVLNAIYTLDHT